METSEYEVTVLTRAQQDDFIRKSAHGRRQKECADALVNNRTFLLPYTDVATAKAGWNFVFRVNRLVQLYQQRDREASRIRVSRNGQPPREWQT